MRLITNLVLIALVIALVWVLINSIQEPIAFKAEKEKRETAVVDKLTKIREAQKYYRDVTGEFAPNFDTMVQVLKTGKIQKISVYGNPDDPNAETALRYDTTYESAMDYVNKLGLNMDSIAYVPFGNGQKFDIDADTLTYQKTLVSVTQVGIRRNKFMGKYGDEKYAMYDQLYEPTSLIKFGNMNAPNLSGNWE